jgi:hypothetical protein
MGVPNLFSSDDHRLDSDSNDLDVDAGLVASGSGSSGMHRNLLAAFAQSFEAPLPGSSQKEAVARRAAENAERWAEDLQ